MRYLVMFVLIFTLTGCDDSSDDSNPVNTPPENQAPEIHSLTATPASLEQGNRCDILCLATDSDGDDLDYFWSAEAGSISGNGNEIEWEAPEVDGQHWVHAYVNDGKTITSDSVAVTVVPKNDQEVVEILSTIGTVGFALDLDLEGDKLYVAENSAGVGVYDVSDPTNVTFVERFETNGNTKVIDGIPQLGCFIAHVDVAYSKRVDNWIFFEDNFEDGYATQLGNSDVSEIVSIMTRDSVRSNHLYGAELVEADVARVLFADASDGIQVVNVWLDSTDMLVFPIDTLLVYSYEVRLSLDMAGKTEAGLAVLDDDFNTVAVSFLDYGVGFGNISKDVDAIDGEWYSVIDTPGEAQGLVYEDNHVFVADGACGLVVIDVTDMMDPELVATWHVDGLDHAKSVFVRNGRLLLLDEFEGVYFFDVSDPDNPVFKGLHELYSPTCATFVNDTTLIVSSKIAGLTTMRMKF